MSSIKKGEVNRITSKEEFDKLLKKEPLVAVDFTASWCGPCRMIGPKFEEMAKEFTNVCFLKVDVDENQDISTERKVSAMPTFMFFKNGVKVDELVGASEPQLRAKLQQLSA